MDIESKKTNEYSEIKKSSENLIYVKKWFKTKNAIILRLSNKIIQVIFKDATEIFLNSEMRVVTYANKKAERLNFNLDTAMESENTEMIKRLKYTKELLTHMFNQRQTVKAYKDELENVTFHLRSKAHF